MAIQLRDQLFPDAIWNTHISGIKSLSDAADRGLDLVEVAGITGLAFRAALCRQVTPPSLYQTWAWSPELLRCTATSGPWLTAE